MICCPFYISICLVHNLKSPKVLQMENCCLEGVQNIENQSWEQCCIGCKLGMLCDILDWIELNYWCGYQRTKSLWWASPLLPQEYNQMHVCVYTHVHLCVVGACCKTRVNLSPLQNAFLLCVILGLGWHCLDTVRDRAPGPFLWNVGSNPREWVELCYCLSKWRFD